jgi:phenylalanine-4-hydroxylase
MLDNVDVNLHLEIITDRSDEEEAVWKILFREVMRFSHKSSWHPPAYRNALRDLLKRFDSLPRLDDLNDWLDPIGWQADYSDGYVSVEQYQQLLSDRIFPVSRAIRRRRDIEHSAAPDFAHDVLGHLPMLFEPRYRKLIETWADLSRSARPSPEDLAVSRALASLIAARERTVPDDGEITDCTRRLTRDHEAAIRVGSRRFLFETFFTWAFEFGLLTDATGRPTLIGGACLSSTGEMARLFTGKVDIRPFRTEAVGHPVDYTIFQKEMFIADSYDDLKFCLDRI